MQIAPLTSTACSALWPTTRGATSLWADPRQLERWWGPPTYPATFTTHDLAPGGRVEFHMIGPEGDQPHGYWEVPEADAPPLPQ